MSPLLQLGGTGVAYVGAFALAGVACLLAVGRAWQIQRVDVRQGLIWLLLATGLWALLKVAYFLLPAPYSRGAYILGLVSGFATVWAWLYFCSAYSGRTYHRRPRLRQFAAAVFLGVVAVKLTNPVHHLYFTTSQATSPFSYLAIEHGVFHWTVTGLSYALAAVGVFMLFELYVNSGYDTRPLAVLTALISLPVGLDILALFFDPLIEVIYAPLGVALFALGVLYVYERRFLAVQSTGDDDDSVIFLDDDERIRDYTPGAAELFPALEGRNGERLDAVLPELAAVLEEETQVFEHVVGGETRYLLTSASSIALGDSEGSVVILSDVTAAERRRRELRRHNNQLEGFANALAHELRNMLQIIEWRLGLAEDRVEDGTVEHESIEKAGQANRRLSDLVDDFTSLARYGQTIDRMEPVEFSTAVDDAWWNAETEGLERQQVTDGTVEADPGRLRELLVNAFTFARLNDAETVSVELTGEGFTMTDDGEPPGEDAEGYFAFGEAVPTAEAGLKLPNVRTFAEVHGWTVDIDLDYQEGVRLVVTGATTTVDEGEAVEAEQ
jgi:signal transduction histidine kinase